MLDKKTCETLKNNFETGGAVSTLGFIGNIDDFDRKDLIEALDQIQNKIENELNRYGLPNTSNLFNAYYDIVTEIFNSFEEEE